MSKGVVTLELAHMPKGARHSKHCTLQILNRDAPCTNLFKIKRTKGWWPLRTNEKDSRTDILAVCGSYDRCTVLLKIFLSG